MPRVNLKTLLSIIRGPGESQRNKSQGKVTVTRETDIEMASYSEVGSVDMEYHSYLENGHQLSNVYTVPVTSSEGHGKITSDGLRG